MPWLSATVMYIPGFIGMLGFCIRTAQASLIPNIKLIKGKAYLTQSIHGSIVTEAAAETETEAKEEDK